MVQSCGQTPCLPIGYARVPVADGSQLLYPRLDALIGDGIFGRMDSPSGNEISGLPERLKMAPYRQRRASAETPRKPRKSAVRRSWRGEVPEQLVSNSNFGESQPADTMPA